MNSQNDDLSHPDLSPEEIVIGFARLDKIPKDLVVPVRGSRDWSSRVLAIIDRDCMDDFDELCRLMGVS